jgi:hypothetical protein
LLEPKHQLLEQIGLLVGSLGRTEAGERFHALLVPDFHEAFCRKIQRFLPRRLAEMREGIRRIDLVVGILARVRKPDQRLCEPMRMMDIVEAKTSLDAEAVVIGGPVAALGIDDLLVLDLIGDLAAHAAKRTQRIDLPVGVGHAGLLFIKHHGRHQRAGRAGLHAFTAGDAGRFTHRIVEVEHDLGLVTAIGHADHVIDLDLAAGTHAQAALDAGVEIDAHGRMAGVALPALGRGEAALCNLDLLGPVPELRLRIV